MCNSECFGDYYRGCQHFVRQYYSGVTEDCMKPNCALSTAHMHRNIRNCQCNKISFDKKRTINLFHTVCKDCAEAALVASAPETYVPYSRW